MVIDYLIVLPSIERILIITWLLKDFGWMSTNIYIGWPFGCAAIAFHTITLLFDPRQTYWYYNASILLWVTGNWIWMSIEYLSEPLSSDIHWGPSVPLTSLSSELVYQLQMIKISLFVLSLIIQFVMYMGILFNRLQMPEDAEENMIAHHELQTILQPLSNLFSYHTYQSCISYCCTSHNRCTCCNSSNRHQHIPIKGTCADEEGDYLAATGTSTRTSPLAHTNGYDQREENSHLVHNHTHTTNTHANNHNNGNGDGIPQRIHHNKTITTALLEHTYISFWIFKDLFWSLGTGK